VANLLVLAVGVGIAGAVLVGGYWLAIRPWHLRWGATDTEVERAMPGDEIIKNPIHVATRAVTIKAKAEEIWPWLVQMGYKRGGMYSYDWIDRLIGVLDTPSAERIIPEFQHLEVGDVIPMGKPPSWPVAAIEPGRSLLVDIRWPRMHYTWVWGLYGLDDSQTRLVLRIRSHLTGKPWIVVFHAGDFGSFLMTRKHLLGIKQRAEALVRQRGEALSDRSGA
jgi:hypothetical protein